MSIVPPISLNLILHFCSFICWIHSGAKLRRISQYALYRFRGFTPICYRCFHFYSFPFVLWRFCSYLSCCDLCVLRIFCTTPICPIISTLHVYSSLCASLCQIAVCVMMPSPVIFSCNFLVFLCIQFTSLYFQLCLLLAIYWTDYLVFDPGLHSITGCACPVINWTPIPVLPA